jgi:hypothetical protein|tara:strand:+ start:1787 stop:1996 length:210 start_codon:yes stop_codon:yes gene_type:complete
MYNLVTDSGGVVVSYDASDLFHRDDGPAVEFANGDNRWWLNNIHLSFDDWLDKVNIPVENKVMMKLIYG